MDRFINNNTILFDGICNLCNASVLFTIKRDYNSKFKFASIQSAAGQIILKESSLPTDELKSIVCLIDGEIYIKSTAVLKVLKELKFPWKLLYSLIIIPKPIRDFFYDLIAKSRYKIFGKRQSCMIPNHELRNRFIE
ncbi:MAG: DCC1-like thiol-disulfide oxidoreductase family protein [Saprospiraceae bacterium]|nr:DCC1-like thiol-disulfide oxidoreductase family protein [Saprospiraceae bacterium]